MLERDAHDLKVENRKLKQAMDSAPRSMTKKPEQDSMTMGMSSSYKTVNDSSDVEGKRELLKKILKTNKLLEKYVAAKKTSGKDPEFAKKLKEKLPQFEYAIKKLEKLKDNYKFHANVSGEHGNSFDKNFTMMLNSTFNTSTNTRLDVQREGKLGDCSESFNKSVKSLINSLKTDNLSKMSDQNYLRELKQNSLAENERVFEEKLRNLELLLAQLKN